MDPALPAGQIWQEVLACGKLGAVLGMLRAFFPVRGKGAFLPDALLVGGVLLGTQSYAASLSVCGVLRWYMWTAAFLAAFGAGAVLGVPLRALGRVLLWPVRWGRKRFALARQRRRNRKNQSKERRNAKRLAKKSKKNLPSARRMLYNSNVSK